MVCEDEMRWPRAPRQCWRACTRAAAHRVRVSTARIAIHPDGIDHIIIICDRGQGHSKLDLDLVGGVVARVVPHVAHDHLELKRLAGLRPTPPPRALSAHWPSHRDTAKSDDASTER
eukprot:1449507-Rhodomonas_salina.2